MAFVIPAIFKAIDQLTGPTQKMSRSVASFAEKANSSFNKLIPTLSETQKQFVSFASSAAAAAAIISTAKFSAQSVMDYETEIQSLSAITGKSGKDLDIFKDKIKEVATVTKESSVNVAKAFTQIGNNTPALLDDAAGMAEVTKQSIILAQAARMQLGPAADYLTTIMNQFNVPAKEAKKTIDLLAGGMVVGSTDIDAVADAMTKFGGVASQVAGVTLPEAITAIEAISDKMKDAALVGTQFRNIFLIMSNLKGQDSKAVKDMKEMGINMKLVADKSVPLIKKLEELKKLQGRAGGLEHVFGKENMQAIIPLLNSTEKYKLMLEKLTTSEEARNAAQKAADKNNMTFARSIEQIKNQFVTWVTTSEQAKTVLDKLSIAARYLGDHLVEILKTGWTIIKWLIAFKALILAIRTITFLYNVYLGVQNFLMLANTEALAGNAVATRASILVEKAFCAWLWLSNAAMTAWTFVVEGASAGMAALNAIMLANPIGLIIIAIAALIALVVVVIKKWNDWGAALAVFMGPLGFVISLIQSFRRNWDMITEAFSKGGILKGLIAIGKTILDAVLMPLQQILKIIAKLTGFEWAGNAVKDIDKFRQNMGVNTTTDESGAPLVDKPEINPREVEQKSMIEKLQAQINGTIGITINDSNNRTSVSGSWSDAVKVKTTSTMLGQ